MTKTLSFNLVFMLALTACHIGKKDTSLNREAFAQHETAKWKKELLANGTVGKPCGADEMRWIAENPESYYGLPDTIRYRFSDCNEDGKDDLLLYFEAGECCTGGHEEGADFLTLCYSSGADYLRNDHLRTEIAAKIEGEYFSQTQTEVRRVIFSVSGFNMEINGTFKLWTLEDPDCCASKEGTFSYNTRDWKIKIAFHSSK